MPWRSGPRSPAGAIQEAWRSHIVYSFDEAASLVPDKDNGAAHKATRVAGPTRTRQAYFRSGIIADAGGIQIAISVNLSRTQDPNHVWSHGPILHRGEGLGQPSIEAGPVHYPRIGDRQRDLE